MIRIDERACELTVGRRKCGISERAASLLVLLADAHVASGGTDAGKVPQQQVFGAKAWSGIQTATSRRRLVCRAVDELNRVANSLVLFRNRQKTLGPYWLASPVEVLSRSESIAHPRSDSNVHGRHDPKDLWRWLESSEAVWRDADAFEREGRLPSRARRISAEDEPLLSALDAINQARRLRTKGQPSDAMKALASARSLAARIPRIELSTAIALQCDLQEAFTHHRRKIGRQEAGLSAKKTLSRAMASLQRSEASGYLRLLGQFLSLRALLVRRTDLRKQTNGRKKLAEAVDDLRRASECYLVEGSLYLIFSVYHNLSLLLRDTAALEDDTDEKLELKRLAVLCARKNIALCDEFHVGQNTVVSRMNLANLLNETGESEESIEQADLAFELAEKAENKLEVLDAHWLRVQLRYRAGLHTGVEALQEDFVRKASPRFRAALSRDYERRLLRERLRMRT